MPELTPSKPIITDQAGPHPHLIATVRKHLTHPFEKPIAAFSHQTFTTLQAHVTAHGGPIILDSCCGIGESTRQLARQFPNHLVIGIDKSAHRLGRNSTESAPANALTIRGDLMDLYRLIAREKWPISHHMILYPNPWPKARHLKRRWHGAPVFPDLIQIGRLLELRSNWHLYLDEVQRALSVAGISSQITAHTPRPAAAITPFERKYSASGHSLWRLTACLTSQAPEPVHAGPGSPPPPTMDFP